MFNYWSRFAVQLLILLTVIHISEGEQRSVAEQTTIDSEDERFLNLVKRSGNQGACQNKCDFLETFAIRTLEKRIDELTQKVELLSKEKNTAASKFLNKGVFTVNLKTHLKGLAAGQTIRFDHIVYDPGNGYDKHTGIFTCPVDGVYMFHMSVLAHPTKSGILGVELMKSGISVACLFEKGTDISTADLVVVRCNAKERVWVRTRTYMGVQDVYGNHYTSFSGSLLHLA